jgi:eukaryotic-like serine/threonine-protein kinase
VGAPTINDPPETSPGVELLTAGSKFARYEIVRCIGVGGMGAVFEATHSLLRKRVALKALHATLGRSDASRARFLREAETVARIRHPNVVDITDVGVERSIPFLVMEFLEGEDVASVLEREGKLEVTRTIDMLLPAVAGLCAVHRLGIVHRDIKPENIFLAVDTLGTVVPKLVDFGVSKDLDASGAEGAPLRHTVAGTPYYMSPEQARGAATLDARADQYAMAVVLYQCLADARPFYSDSLLELLHTIDAGEYVPLQKRVPELPDALASVIERAMSRRLEDRFPTTEAFGQALSEFASEAVKNASARDFSAERRSALPPAQRRWSEAERERQSAPTRQGDDLLPAASPTLEERPSRLSGVRARDTEPESGPLPARSRRAFVLAFGVTLILLLVLGAFLYKVPTPSTVKVIVEPPHASRKGAEPLASPAPKASAGQPAAPAEPGVTAPPSPAREQHDKDSERPRAKPRRQEGPSPGQPAPVDIQLSR